MPGAPVADRLVLGHAEAAGDDLDEEVPGQEEVAEVVQRSQVKTSDIYCTST